MSVLQMICLFYVVKDVFIETYYTNLHGIFAPVSKQTKSLSPFED